MISRGATVAASSTARFSSSRLREVEGIARRRCRATIGAPARCPLDRPVLPGVISVGRGVELTAPTYPDMTCFGCRRLRRVVRILAGLQGWIGVVHNSDLAQAEKKRHRAENIVVFEMAGAARLYSKRASRERTWNTNSESAISV